MILYEITVKNLINGATEKILETENGLRYLMRSTVYEVIDYQEKRKNLLINNKINDTMKS